MKLCQDCNTEKPFSDFYFSKGRPYSPCKICRKIRDKDYYELNKEKVIARVQEWSKTNKDPEYYKKHYFKNPDCYKRASAKYTSKPHVKAKRAAKQKQREFFKRASFPLYKNWIAEIEMVYLQAKDCELVTGEKYHVDHIIPLCGKNVCGLHVPWNLQVLPSDLNLKKGNRYE